ncbi:hypothetical protein C2845_PM07G36650 [Panicum miliaceum]|uniref:Uncharacterized protein n=1 Tax=Panicum miliaceum TaxID=4540 RepID=A0A3L6SSA4_PANMI|nr:hypothetical protein C2845_PM07G36650 [Panicum miliaceum]
MPWPLGSCCCHWTRHTGQALAGDGGSLLGNHYHQASGQLWKNKRAVRNSWRGDSAGSAENRGTKYKYLAHRKIQRGARLSF